MRDTPEVTVLRLGHRPGRDERMTTHVGLTARALGADRVVLESNATSAADTVEDITGRFGGPFDIDVTDSVNARIRDWDGRIVHLTMYGLPVQDVMGEVCESHRNERTPLLVVVGAEKVPFEVYERADWNVAVTNQPHSEVASLAVFLDRLFDGEELDREWKNAEQTVVPKATGKLVEDTAGESTSEE